jgi:hypothetical protein
MNTTGVFVYFTIRKHPDDVAASEKGCYKVRKNATVMLFLMKLGAGASAAQKEVGQTFIAHLTELNGIFAGLEQTTK